MPIDFEADQPTPEATPEGAATAYAATSPDVVSTLGALAMSTTGRLQNAADRGQYADASWFDRMLGRNVSDEADVTSEFGAAPAATPQPIKEPLLPADQVNRQFGPQGPDGAPIKITDAPMSAGLAQVIAKQKTDEMNRDDVWSRYAANHNPVTNFGVGMVGFMLDPLNVGSMFVPGIGEEAILGGIGRAGFSTSGMVARTAARLGAGAAAGVAQQAPLVGLEYGLGTEQASDYDLRSAFKDLAFGAAFGAIAHAGMGGLREAGVLAPDELMKGHGAVDTAPGNAFQGSAAVPQADVQSIKNATLEQREAAMRAGVSQVVDGRQVDVAPIISAEKPGVDGAAVSIPDGISPDLARRARVLSSDSSDVPPSQALEEAAIRRAPKEIQDALFSEPAQDSRGNAADNGRGAGRDTRAPGEPADAVQGFRPPGTAGGGATAGILEDAGRAPATVGADASGRADAATGRVFYGSRSLGVRYELAEASALRTSHTPAFAVNPDFPAELQPRDRSAIPARNQVNAIAANLQPERLGPSPEANSGAPIVGPDGVVESGNGRTMAIRQAYAAGGDRAAAYRAHIEALGYDTTGFHAPVLVARRLTDLTPEQRIDFAHATASSEAQRLGTKETALSDARAITPDVSQHLQPGDVASAANREFVKAFVAKMSQGEAAGMLTGDGSLSAVGVSRLRAAIAARAYGDASVIARAFENRDSNIKSIATALTDSAATWIKMREAVERGAIAASEDVTPDVMRAVQTIMRARDNGERMSDAFRQTDMFASGLPHLVTRFFFKGDDFGRFFSAAAIGDNLSIYARDLVEGQSRGQDMFGNSAPAAGDVLAGLVDRNRTRAATLGEDAPPLSASDLAQQQAALTRDGFAPGIPQAEFDAAEQRLYGPKADAAPAPVTQLKPAAEPAVTARDPETEALEARVLASSALSAIDREAIAAADRGIADAAARGEAYGLAGEMLARGERLGPDVMRLLNTASQDVLAMVRAYHGTPHAFDRFDASKIGIGEGNQAYGHGLYFAENERVAKQYRDDLSPATQDISVGGRPFDYAAASEPEQRAFDSLYSKDQWVPDVDHAIRETERRLKSVADLPRSAAKFREQLDTLRGWKEQGLENTGGSQGHLYDVAIDREPEHFLDWDAAREDQSRYVLDALEKAGIKPDHEYPNHTGRDLYLDALPDRTRADASQALHEAGIAGIRYLDGGSRGAGDGTRNYVVFNHDDVKITHRNGDPVTAAERADVLASLRREQDVAPRISRPIAASGDSASTDQALSLRNLKTGEAVRAQAVAPLSNMLQRFDVSRDAAADPIQRASHLVIGERLSRMIGDMRVFTVGPAEMRTLAEGRMRIQPGFEPAGFFDPASGHIVVLDDALRDPRAAASLMVHEGLHGAFMRTINTSEAARSLIEELQSTASAAHIDRGGEAADHYGLTNAHEFVSEAFANPEFQRFLAGIDAPPALFDALGLPRGTLGTMWDALVGAVRKILGFAPEQHTLLDAAMRAGEMLEGMRSAEQAGGEAGILPNVRAAGGGDISRIERAVAARGKLGPGEARTLIREVADRAEQMRQTGMPDPYVAAARDLADKIQENARKDKLDALRNADARTKILNRIDQAGGMAVAPEQLRAMLHGTYRSGLDSVQAQFRGLASTWQAALSSKLHRLGLEKAAISGELDEAIAKDLWSMNAGGGEGSGNKLARQAAEAIHPVLEEIKDRLNALGARIGDATDYVATTRHDPYKMRRAAGSGRNTPDQAFATWWNDTQPLLAEKTFADLTPREGETVQQARTRFARSVYDALITGIHMTPEGISGVKYDPAGGARSGPAFEGSRNLAKKVSQDRTLFWKDGAAWNSYMQTYGLQTSLVDGVMRTITQASKQIALMERFGSNPMANLNLIEQAIKERGRADFEGIAAFGSKMNGVRDVMAYLDGSANIPANADWAAIGNNIRTYYSVADLGGVGVTHFASIWPTVSSEMRHHGISRLETLGNIVTALVKRKGDVERQAIMSDLGAYADGLTRDMSANWQPDSPKMGRMSSLANTFMKYTGIYYVFDNTQAAVRSMLSHNLARNLTSDFETLEPHLQNMLGSYGIGAQEWGLLRSLDGLKTENGRAYLTPRDVLRIDPALLEQHLRSAGELAPTQDSLDLGTGALGPEIVDAATTKLAQSLSDRLGSYFSDVAAHSTVTAGARERAMLLGGSRAGTLGGEFMRFVTQFKMWPVAAYDQLLRREIQMSTSKADAAWGIGSMMALSAASGYLRMTVNDTALGHPVRNPLEWQTALAGLAQGGGLGILGDFLFGEVNRMGGGLIDVAGGPIISDVDSLLQIYNRFRRDITDPASHHKNGTFADVWPDLAHFGVRHIPFANLVYLKGTLDYLMFYHLYEAASPGWWDRTNRRLQKEQGRTMTGYTPGGGVPVGVPGLYMQNRGGQTFGLLGGVGPFGAH